MFYDNVHSEDSDKFFNNKVSLNRRYGASLDLGVDFDFGISGYFINGMAALDYKVDWVDFEDGLIFADDPSYETKKTSVSGTSWAYFYGIGVAYTPVEWLSLALEYTQQSNTLDAIVPGGYATTGIVYDRVLSDTKIFKFGVAYHF